jgi:hypothetical protein
LATEGLNLIVCLLGVVIHKEPIDAAQFSGEINFFHPKSAGGADECCLLSCCFPAGITKNE